MRLAIDEICSTGGESSLVPDNLLRLKSQVLRVEKLVKDLLNLSALEVMGGIDSRPVDITGLLSGLLAEYKFMADALHIKMDVRLPPGLVVMGDPEKLSRAFSNIIDNALKYNQDGGRIEAIAEQSEAGLVITIENTGAGIAENELPRVFDQFYRIEKSRSSHFGGSGLGLTIVKRIVELHGGEIKMESRLEEWTRITVLLPNCVEAKLGL
jgi:signal transduction histidine kinase